MTLREDIVNLSGSTPQWALHTAPVKSPQIVDYTIKRHEQGHKLRLSVQMWLSKKLGISVKAFQRKYLTNEIERYKM